MNERDEIDAPECGSCEGTGLAWYPHPEDPLFSLAEDCPRCDGWGTRVTSPAQHPDRPSANEHT